MTAVFNTRELAIGIWIVVALTYAITKRSVRRSLSRLVSSFFQPKILLLILTAAAYTGAVVLLMYRLSLWNWPLLKDTITWFVVGAVGITVGRITSRKDELDIRTLLTDGFKLVVLLQFIVNTYTLSLPLELGIVPSVVCVGAMSALTERDVRHANLHRIVIMIQIMISIGILVIAFWKAIGDVGNVFTVENIRSLLLSPVLTITYIPCLYLLVLRTRYETLVIRLRFAVKRDPELLRYARKQCFRACRLSLRRLNAASTRLVQLFRDVPTRSSVDTWLRPS